MEIAQYLDMFLDESKEHLQACNELLLALEKNPEDLAIVNEIFRSAHTLKGMSATMGYGNIVEVTHKMENILDAIRNSKINVTTEILDIVFKAVDLLEEMVLEIEAGGTGEKDVSEIVHVLNRIESEHSILSSSSRKETPTQAIIYDEFEMAVISQSQEEGFNAFEVRVLLGEDCILKAARVFMVFELVEKFGEIIKSTPSIEQLENEDFDLLFTVVLLTKIDANTLKNQVMNISEVENVLVHPVTVGSVLISENEEIIEYAKSELNPKIESRAVTVQNTSKTIRVNTDRLDTLMNLFEELIIDRGRLQSIADELHNEDLDETVERMTRITGDLQSIILKMRMVPVETVFNRFPKMVRQLARDLEKTINLKITGAKTELDRTVMDKIGDPLVHLLRNAIDHGIESPAVRLEKGKPAEGSISLRAYHSGNHVFIEMEDDGAGINKELVMKKAIKSGIVTAEFASSLTDEQILELIMSPGFSTAEKVTDLSGRGVGMDVVKSKIESLGGYIAIQSEKDRGTLFRIQLPLTLSIISVMLVNLDEDVYAIPLSSIHEVAIIRTSDIMSGHNQKLIDVRGSIVPLVNLKEIFEMDNGVETKEFQSIVIVQKGEKMAGLIVDSFIGQQEIVLKSLGNYLQSVFAISGATILGTGRVALIVDCNALIK
ncbi:chemotaxis protein CheA [Sporosarcina thermotolerans]|uniref:Chemotaxis protein CheA n=1 Tax=Sporosarcina thermotolerans TaxID=633404 RepID=A0AAW9A6B4_9BACL|nr:chemotaxis protein CheA [Sporosarcina thermotolerans]MDW0115714.1 chemotaxis protein CheA [Sporosarcina thermotolerans]